MKVSNFWAKLNVAAKKQRNNVKGQKSFITLQLM
jgi:hypothetical protein